MHQNVGRFFVLVAVIVALVVFAQVSGISAISWQPHGVAVGLCAGGGCR